MVEMVKLEIEFSPYMNMFVLNMVPHVFNVNTGLEVFYLTPCIKLVQKKIYTAFCC